MTLHGTVLAITASIGAAAIVGGAIAGAPQRAPAKTSPAQTSPDKTSLLLRADPASLAAIEIATGRPEVRAPRREAITDLVVRLMPAVDGMPVGVALGLDNAGRPEPADRAGGTRGERVLLAAELILAVAGRIVVEERARCAAWVAEASLCQTACGSGGGFMLARLRDDRGGVTLRLVVGELSPGDAERGARLGACSERADGTETSLAPRSGLRIAEVVLAGD